MRKRVTRVIFWYSSMGLTSQNIGWNEALVNFGFFFVDFSFIGSIGASDQHEQSQNHSIHFCCLFFRVYTKGTNLYYKLCSIKRLSFHNLLLQPVATTRKCWLNYKLDKKNYLYIFSATRGRDGPRTLKNWRFLFYVLCACSVWSRKANVIVQSGENNICRVGFA
jgi:hypothetical protein